MSRCRHVTGAAATTNTPGTGSFKTPLRRRYATASCEKPIEAACHLPSALGCLAASAATTRSAPAVRMTAHGTQRVGHSRSPTHSTVTPAKQRAPRSSGGRGGGVVEVDGAFDDEAEASAAGLFDADRRVALVEAALEEDEARVEVVAEAG